MSTNASFAFAKIIKQALSTKKIPLQLPERFFFNTLSNSRAASGSGLFTLVMPCFMQGGF